MKKKAFFACSMRGGHDVVSQEVLKQIPDALKEIGLELMSRHQTQDGIIQEEDQKTTVAIHDRDYAWLKRCNIVVAEISNPSLGVGAEISDAIHLEKPVLGLYQMPEDKISAYIRGKLEGYPMGSHAQYKDLDDLKRIAREFADSV